MKNYDVAPTEKQIEFADIIASALNIDFPTCSQEYNKWTYQQFISDYIYMYQQHLTEDPIWYDDEMAWFDPFAEGGY